VKIQEILESMLEQCDEVRSQSTQSADAVNRFKGKLVKVHKQIVKQIVYDRLLESQRLSRVLRVPKGLGGGAGICGSSETAETLSCVEK